MKKNHLEQSHSSLTLQSCFLQFGVEMYQITSGASRSFLAYCSSFTGGKYFSNLHLNLLKLLFPHC